MNQLTPIKTHLKIHTANKKSIRSTKEDGFPCTVCSRKFTSNFDLVVHSQRKHFREENCFPEQKPIHQNHHPQPEDKISVTKAHVCTDCNKNFFNKSHFITHQRIHTGEKPYVCTVCNKGFSDKSNFITHQRIHTGEKPYVCNVCDKRFNLAFNLTQHQRVHTGEKPYICTVCDKRFAQSVGLIRHKRRANHTI